MIQAVKDDVLQRLLKKKISNHFALDKGNRKSNLRMPPSPPRPDSQDVSPKSKPAKLPQQQQVPSEGGMQTHFTIIEMLERFERVSPNALKVFLEQAE